MNKPWLCPLQTDSARTEFELTRTRPSFKTMPPIPDDLAGRAYKDFRPISLRGSAYKISAKLLVGSLRRFPIIISHSQGAFVHGRQILDGVLVANKCVHSRFKENSLVLLCKLDLEKANDRIGWAFLSYMMRRIGFGDKWIRWTEECVFLLVLYPHQWHPQGILPSSKSSSRWPCKGRSIILTVGFCTLFI